MWRIVSGVRQVPYGGLPVASNPTSALSQLLTDTRPLSGPQVGGLSHQLQRLHRSERSAWRRVAQLETSAGVSSSQVPAAINDDVDAEEQADTEVEPHVPHEELQLQPQATAPVPAAWRTTRLSTLPTKATHAQPTTVAKHHSSPANTALTRSPRRTPLRALQSQATPPPVHLGALPR
jgi:hypothetical protein